MESASESTTGLGPSAEAHAAIDSTLEADAVRKDGDGSSSVWIRPEQRLNDPWELKRGFTVVFEISPNRVSAIPQLNGISEYGEGATQSEALEDLLTSFTDYREWLEEREERLHADALADLAALRALIQRKKPDAH